MSDFLTNLVMRSFAQTPSVQPMTLSTYAAPEPPVDPAPVEQFLEPVQKTEVVQKNTDEHESIVVEKAPVVTKTSPPGITETLVPPPHPEKNSDSRDPEPTLVKSMVPEEPRAMSKPDPTIAVPIQAPQRTVKPPVRVQKVTEPLIVEQVIEHVVERPTVKTIERPTIKTIEQSTFETIERPSVTSRERSIEHSSVTIENTEHVTSSFTTLVPKVTPQAVPALNLKPRPIAPPPAEIPGDEQQQATTAPPETVVNVAIGRIEVRATPAQASRREREQGPKVMTLDDYLQQRSRGTQ